MAEGRVSNPLVEQFRRGGVPRDIRFMAARGLVALKPEDLLELWTVLASDADEAVRIAAEGSLLAFPAAELLPIVKSRDTPVAVLAWAVSKRAEPELCEATLQNHSLPDEVIEQLAPTLPQALAELVVCNQTRLLRRTSLLVALESNVGLNNDQKRRLRDLRETFRVGRLGAALPVMAAKATPEEPKNQDRVSRIIGIDPGTTRSCVVAMEDGVPRVIPNQEGAQATQSVVAFTAIGERLVGAPASRQALTNIDGTVDAVMRLLGRRFSSREAANARRSTLCPLVEGPEGDVQVMLRNKSYSTTEILSFLLSDLKASAENSLGESIEAAVISCPATFYDAQRRALKEAGFMAGLETVSLINATTAAALAYQAERKAGRGVVAVFHLGGGTFDISIVEFARGLCKVRSRAGDSFLGGEDFDWRIVDWLIAQFGRDSGIDLGADGMTLRRIKEAAERAKRELSTAQQTKISLPFIYTDPSGPRHLSALLTRGQYEALTLDLLDRLAKTCRQCLADADLEVNQIDEVLLVGGQTRAPRVRQLVRGLFGREPSRVIDPEWGIAIGAAIQASRLAREQQEDTLLDVTPFTLGIEGEDGRFTRIIERNTPIPTHRRQILMTGVDYQTRMAVHVLQGESDQAAENESLGQLVFTVPSALAGEAHLEVDFDIDEDGIVSVELLAEPRQEVQSVAEIRPTSEFRGPLIAIDFGTTNSCVAVMEGGVPQVIPNQEGARTTPSIVGFTAKGERLVGQIAKRQALTNPKNTVFAVKRLIGRKFDSHEAEEARKFMPFQLTSAPNGDVHLQIEDKVYSPPEISSFVLQKLKAAAEDYLGEAVEEAIITVPAYFNDQQRQATKDAARIAGLVVPRIINEPTAAALAWGRKRSLGAARRVAVYDLGGGTFDISILELADGLFQVRATAGDTFLGGEDFDQRIVDWLTGEFQRETGIDLWQDRMALQRLKEAAEKAKCALSTAQQTEIVLPFISADASGPKHLNTVLTRGKYEELTDELLEKTIKPCQQCLFDAQMKPEQIDEVLLVGGQTRAPKVAEIVRRIFGKEPNRVIDPDEGVAMGAAIQAGIVQGEIKDLTSLDVTPHTLGIETRDGTFTPLIARNSTIPTRKSRVFTTVADTQARIEVHILQGESNMAAHNKSLAKFELTNIPPAPRGVPQIEVGFEIDMNGIVSVEATDQATGRRQAINIHTSGGLSQADINRLVAETRARESGDEAKKEQEAFVRQLDGLVANTMRSVQALEGKLTTDEQQRVLDSIEKARKTRKSEDKSKSKKEQEGVVRQLDALVANTMRSVQAFGGKLTPDEQQRIVDSIEKAKKTLNGGSLEELKAALSDMEKAAAIIDWAMLRR